MQGLAGVLLAEEAGDAIFDMDGTLIRGDIGESVMFRVLDRPDLPEVARRHLGDGDRRAAYAALCARDFCLAGDVALQCLAGLTVGRVEALVAECLAAGDVAINAPVLGLARAIGQRHRVWILTGSGEIIGRAMGRHLGIAGVVGLRVRMDGDRLTDEIVPPCTCGQGKVEAARALISRRPVFSIGDSPTDLPLLRTAIHARTLGRIAGVEFPAFEG